MKTLNLWFGLVVASLMFACGDDSGTGNDVEDGGFSSSENQQGISSESVPGLSSETVPAGSSDSNTGLSSESVPVISSESAPVSSASVSQTDVFGSKMFYATAEGSVVWTSEHWANGNARSIDWDGDPDDPLGWTDNRSGGSASPYFKIDGQGVMQMMSSEPRFHINAHDNNSSQKQFFKNVEWTGYYRRGDASANGPDWGGMVVGVRSGNLGHNSSGGSNCDASTYYARFRHDGKWDFEKEWKHPDSYYQSMGMIGVQTPLWGGEKLPVNRWIGMKYIVYNSSETSVHLELYIDSISGGEPSLAKWEKVGEADDAGTDWSGAANGAATISGCESYNGLVNAYSPILEGHGAVLMRTDGNANNVVQAEYKYVTVREIDPSARLE